MFCRKVLILFYSAFNLDQRMRSNKYCYIIRSLTDVLADTIKLVTVEQLIGQNKVSGGMPALLFLKQDEQTILYTGFVVNSLN